jgi:hypothetical protein
MIMENKYVRGKREENFTEINSPVRGIFYNLTPLKVINFVTFLFFRQTTTVVVVKLLQYGANFLLNTVTLSSTKKCASLKSCAP